MTLTVSITELRNNISSYLDKVKEGDQVLIKDNKRRVTVAQITKVHSFDRDSFLKTMERVAGVFSAENHPEWATKEKVIKWLRKTRQTNQRSF